jgi:hypothetical protein
LDEESVGLAAAIAPISGSYIAPLRSGMRSVRARPGISSRDGMVSFARALEVRGEARAAMTRVDATRPFAFERAEPFFCNTKR